MKPRRFIPPLVAVTLLALSLTAVAREYSIDAEEWARPRSGEMLLSLSAVTQLMHDFEGAPNAGIEIRYPGGEMGLLWAEELQAWLVALGVPSTRIVSTPGSSGEDKVDMVLVRPAQ